MTGQYRGRWLTAATGPEYWAADDVDPTPAGHAGLAVSWLRLVAWLVRTIARNTGEFDRC